jgi:hypothetical protein
MIARIRYGKTSNGRGDEYTAFLKFFAISDYKKPIAFKG